MKKGLVISAVIIGFFLILFSACREDIDPITGGNRVTELNLTNVIPKPIVGELPLTSYTGGSQYTLSIIWRNAHGLLAAGARFSSSTVYTATATILTLQEGLTLAGLRADSFYHSYAESVVYNLDITITIVFWETPPQEPITITDRNLTNIIPQPQRAQPPLLSFNGSQYSLAITWKDDNGAAVIGNFQAEIAYTAVAVITPREGWLLEGLEADSFTHNRAIPNGVTFDLNRTITLVFPAIPSVDGHPLPPDQSLFQLPRQVGDFLALTALDPLHAPIVNNMGMSGRAGRNHWHGNAANGMFAGSRQDFIFDIGRIEQLGELHIWNYNLPGSTGNGIRNVRILLSNDNVEYREVGTFTLRQADGSARLLATNLTNGRFIDLNGRSARYIKLSPIDNHGGGLFGLSEIRLFRYKQNVYRGAYISASPIITFANPPPARRFNLTNGIGLSHPFSADALHDNNPAHMYHVSGTFGDFIIDLRGMYPIERIVIWNYNAPGSTNYGLRTITVSRSNNALGDSPHWTSIASGELPQANGQNGLVPSMTIPVNNLHARYIRITGNNWGGANSGLSAIRVYTGTGWFADFAPDWTALFSNFSGWTGADGIYSVNLDGRQHDPTRNPSNKRTFFIFSDTITGNVDPVTDNRPAAGRGMPNNTFATLIGGRPDTTRITFHYPASGVQPIAPNPPAQATNPGFMYYWLGDAFVIGNNLYVFSLLIDRVTGPLGGFQQVGVDLARFNIVDGNIDFASRTLINDGHGRNRDGRLSDISDPNNLWFLGGAVVVNTEEAGAISPDGFIYVFGYNDRPPFHRDLIVARIKAGYLEDFSKFEYLLADGTWSTEPWGPGRPPRIMANHVAPEISVHQVQTGPDRGKFYLVYTHFTITPDIRIAVSPDLTTPFVGLPGTDPLNPGRIFYHDTMTAIVGTENTTYNAKAHAAISNELELFISYNINGGWPAFNFGDIYRPRFIRFAQVPIVGF